MIKDIVTSRKRLKNKCEHVEDMDTLKRVAMDLVDTANKHGNACAGLAANQIGHNARVIVIKMDNEFRPFINPEIVRSLGGYKPGWEGCLSFPGKKNVRMWRYNQIFLKWMDLDGVKHERKYKNYTARVMQHELDHLEGISIYD